MFNDFAQGFFIELTLVVTVGLQNAFIIKQGLKSSYVSAAVLACWLCETLLVTVGVAGVGAFINSKPAFLSIIILAGTVFLIIYAIKSFFAAFKADINLETDKIEDKKSLFAVIGAGAGFALLNPHVLIDTTLMGAISSRYYPHQWIFLAGVITAALIWYSFLGLTSKLLAKPLKNKKTWRIINIVIGLFCLYMAFNFILDLVSNDYNNHGHTLHSPENFIINNHNHN